MQKQISKPKAFARKHLTPSLVLCGLLGGFINGLVGAGAGIVFVFVLRYLFSEGGADGERDIFALSLSAVFFVTLFSVFFYLANGNMHISSASSLILPAALGGLAGAVLLGKINTALLRAVFAVLIIYSGFSMM